MPRVQLIGTLLALKLDLLLVLELFSCRFFYGSHGGCGIGNIVKTYFIASSLSWILCTKPKGGKVTGL